MDRIASIQAIIKSAGVGDGGYYKRMVGIVYFSGIFFVRNICNNRFFNKDS